MARSAPSCATHNVAFKRDLNGVAVIELDSLGGDYWIQWGDRWRCPVGGELIISGFGDRVHRDEPGFASYIESYTTPPHERGYREANNPPRFVPGDVAGPFK